MGHIFGTCTMDFCNIFIFAIKNIALFNCKLKAPFNMRMLWLSADDWIRMNQSGREGGGVEQSGSQTADRNW
jgi:hypothetical protein